MRDCLDDALLQSYFDGELSNDQMADVSVHLASCIGCTRAVREMESENLLLAEALMPEFAVAVPTERLRHRVDAAVAGLQVVKPGRVGHANAGGSPALPGISGWLQTIRDLITFSPQRAFGYAGLAAVVVLAAIVGVVQLRRSPVALGTTEVATLLQNSVPNPLPNPDVTSSPAPVTGTAPENASHPNQLAGYHPRSAPAPRRAEAPKVQLLPGERSYLQQIASLDSSLNANGSRPMRPGLQAEYERNLELVNRAIAATRNAAKSNPNDPDAAEFMFAAYQSKVDLLNQVAEARLSNRPQ